MNNQIAPQLVQISFLGLFIAIVLSAIGSIPMILGHVVERTTTNSRHKPTTSFAMIALNDIGIRLLTIFVAFSCIKALSVVFELDLDELIAFSRFAPILRDPQMPIPDILREPVLPLLKFSSFALCIIDFVNGFPICKTTKNWTRFNPIIYGILVGTIMAFSIILVPLRIE